MKIFDDKDKIIELLDKKYIEERTEITDEVLAGESRAFIESLSFLVERERALTALNAAKWSDYYWDANYSARESDDKSEHCYIGTRVRFVNSSMALEWFRNSMAFNTKKPGKKKIFSTYITKGKSHRYSRSKFKNEPAWAVDVINYVEDRYELNRKRNAILRDIQFKLKEYKELIDRLEVLSNE